MILMLKCGFTSTETVGLLGTGAQDVHLDYHTAPEFCVPMIRAEHVIYCEWERGHVVQRERRLELIDVNSFHPTKDSQYGLCQVKSNQVVYFRNPSGDA